MKEKAGRVEIDTLIIAILVFLVVVVVLIFIFKPDILDYIKQLPEYKYDEDQEIDISKLSPDELIKMGISCEVKIAFIGDKPDGNWLYQWFWEVRELFMFRDGGMEKTKLYVGIKDENNMEIWILEGWNKKIGLIENSKLTIDKESFNDEKVLSFISLDDLKMLNNSILVKPRFLCKSKEDAEKEKTSVEELSRKIKKITIEGFDFYFDVYDFMKNTGLKTTDLYLDEKLNEKANSWITKEGQISRQPENGEDRKYASFVDVKLIDEGAEDIHKYTNYKEVYNLLLYAQLGKDGETNRIPLKTKIDNSDNRLGVDTGGDDFVYVYYKIYNGKTYVRFEDGDLLASDKTPWILMDYWNEFRSFARAPDYSLLK